jgi:hypothetical protein
MGREATCMVHHAGTRAEAIVLLETEELILRRPFSTRLRFTDIERVEATGGDLRLRVGGQWTVLAIGDAAGQWADRIRSPKGLLDKLGVGPDHHVVVTGIDDAGFVAQVAGRTGRVSQRVPRKGADMVVFGARTTRALDRLGALRDAIAPAGAVWVVWPKGGAALKEDHVRAAAREAGLVDVKVVKFSETHSALKLVVPRSAR